MAEELVREIDSIRDTIGVDRGALIKIWLYERVKQEKVLAGRPFPFWMRRINGVRHRLISIFRQDRQDVQDKNRKKLVDPVNPVKLVCPQGAKFPKA